MRDVCLQRGDINGDKQDIGVKGIGEKMEDGKEMVQIFDMTVGTGQWFGDGSQQYQKTAR